MSCTSCNLCKDDGVVHACTVCLTDSVGTLIWGVGGHALKETFCFTVHEYSPIMQISVLFIDSILSLDHRTSLEDRTLLEDRVTGGQAIADR